LVKQVLNYLDPKLQGTMEERYLDIVIATGVGRDRVTTFREGVSQARVGSVDAFIAKRPAYRRVGRTAIAAALIRRESDEHLHRPPDRAGWFELLFRAMTHGREPFEQNRLSVTALAALYPGGAPGARERFAAIPLVHLHGVLGKYPPLSRGHGRPYQPTLSAQIVKQAERAIKIIPDDEDHDGPLEQDDEFERAYELLAEAERVVFLGFGFDPLNVRRLALAQYLADDAGVVATSKGVGRQRIEEVAEEMEVVGRFEHFDATCTELLDTYKGVLVEP
jgi:hypothetical protein